MPDSKRFPRPVRVVAAVACRDGSYLVCQRPPSKRHGGLWEFPGGKLLDGETLEQAARRELREELDLEVRGAGAVLLRVPDPGSAFVVEFLEVTVEGEPLPREHDRVAWVPKEKLLELPLCPSDKAFAESLAPSTPRPPRARRARTRAPRTPRPRPRSPA